MEEGQRRRRFRILASGGFLLPLGAKLGVHGNEVRGGLRDGSKSRREAGSNSVN